MATILSKLADFGNNIKLSLTQWLLLLLATTVGALVAALRLQGSQLHKAQVDLLESRVDNTIANDEEARVAAVQKFQAAYTAYLRGKKP